MGRCAYVSLSVGMMCVSMYALICVLYACEYTHVHVLWLYKAREPSPKWGDLVWSHLERLQQANASQSLPLFQAMLIMCILESLVLLHLHPLAMSLSQGAGYRQHRCCRNDGSEAQAANAKESREKDARD